MELDNNYRIEKDLLGEKEIPKDAYYGINTVRAMENFNISNKKVNINLIRALVIVKKSASITHKKLKNMEEEKANAIINACDDILTGEYDCYFTVDALQGGAGTSTNMNVNEVIANRAIELLGGNKGDYTIIHPIHHVNMSQSTNDVYPTALRIAAINLLRPLSNALASLQDALQVKENEFSDIIKLGRTELMDALPMMVGQGFGAYARAIARDRWRIYKVEERLREVNIGGTAIGTGMNAASKYIFLMTDILREQTGLGIARSDYPMDTTQNMDVFVEVSGLLKSAAVNLMKIANDLRLLGSGPKGGFGELMLPEVQAGSSIMAGKVNPVIAEMISQVSMKVIANDSSITFAAASGQLELNAFGPLIADSLLESLEILTNAVKVFEEKCIKGIQVNEDNCKKHLEASTASATALLHYIGYDRASEIAKMALKENKTIEETVLSQGILPKEELEQILNPYQLTKPGIPGK
ncbi:MAG: aspartate ammonia-lyase [Bacillota bacterium]|nr:aspartate ammonia-lyase [Bacillota bacterium]